MTAIQVRQFREVYLERTGRSPTFDKGPVWCPECEGDAALDVHPLLPTFDRAEVRCANGCPPVAIAVALGLGANALVAMPAKQTRADGEANDQPIAESGSFAGTPCHSLRDLLDDASLLLAPEPVAAPLVYLGKVTLLAAREKAGKSTIAGQIAAAVSRGGDFLGKRVTQRRVLWISLDEGRDDVVRRFQRFDAHPDFLDVAFALQGDDLPRWLSDAARCPALVVIDSLSELVTARGKSLNRPEEFLPVLRPLVTALRAVNAAGLWIAHSSKSRGEYAGAVQLGALADATLTLKTMGGGEPSADPSSEPDDDVGAIDDGKRILVGRTRWGGQLRQRLAFAGGRYVPGDAPLSVAHRVLLALEAENAPISISGLAKALHVRGEVATRETGALRREGYVTQVPHRGVTLTDSGRWAIRDGVFTRSGSTAEHPSGTPALSLDLDAAQ